MSNHEAPEEKVQTLRCLRDRIAHLEAENERLQASEKALHEQTRRQQDILDAVPSPVFFKDVNGRYTGCNAAFAAILGIEREALVGKSSYDVAPREVADKAHEVDCDLLSKGGKRSYETKVPDKDGGWGRFTVNKAVLADPGGNAAGLVGVMTDVTERRAAEDALRESEEKYRTLVENAGDTICTIDENGTYLFVNAIGAEQFGARPEDVIGKNLADFFPPELAARHVGVVRQVIRTGEAVVTEAETQVRGTKRWYNASVQPLRDRSGGTASALVLLRDITERKEAEQALRESEKRYHDLFENLNDAAFLADAETGMILETNRQGEVLLGRPRDEIVGMHQSQLHPPGQAEEYRRRFAGHVARRHAADHDAEVVRKDGTTVPVAVSASTVSMEGRKLILGLFRDITDPKRAEDLLRRSEERLRAILEAAESVSIITTDLAGAEARIEQFSPGAERMFDYTRDEAVGQKLAILHLAEDVAGFPAMIEAMRRERTGFRGEATLIRKSGEKFPALLTIDPIFDPKGNMTAVVGVSIDITELKRAEQALRDGEQAERRFREMLTALHEVSNELTEVESFDEFCRQAVVLGRQRLGFDRLGLWFLGDEPDTIRGSFGTDEGGLLRDERALQIPASAKSPLGQVLGRKLPIFVEEDAELCDAGGNVIARGPKVIAPLSDGDDVIGCLATDNLLRGQAIGPYERELLRLYAATLGHLCSRKRADEALRQSERKYRALTESTNDVVYSVDAEGTLTYVGPQIARYGRTPQEMLSHSFLDFVVPQDRDQVATDFRKSISTGREFPSQFRIRGEEGAVRWVEDWGKVQRDETGKIVGITGVLRDITEHKQAETDLREARRKLTVAREAERRRLAREVHDSLGQQLIGLQLGLEGVTADLAGGIGDKAADSLRCLADGFGELIREVRSISHGLYPPTLESFGLTASLAQLAQSYAPSAQIEVKHPQTLAEVRFDPEVEIAMFRIAQEAVNNAVRHSQAKMIVIDLKQRKGEVVLSVSDDGSGFDVPGAAGNGLGLTAMTERADAVGGSIRIESKPGRTRIRVSVPLA